MLTNYYHVHNDRITNFIRTELKLSFTGLILVPSLMFYHFSDDKVCQFMQQNSIQYFSQNDSCPKSDMLLLLFEVSLRYTHTLAVPAVPLPLPPLPSKK